MTEQEQSTFSGWAVVEQMGHNKYAGYVTTHVFGTAALFRIDTPELPEREFRLTRPMVCDGENEWTPAGSLVKRVASPAFTKLIGPSSIFAITPCSEAFVRETLEHITPRPLIVLERPAKAAIAAANDADGHTHDDDEDIDFDDPDPDPDGDVSF